MFWLLLGRDNKFLPSHRKTDRTPSDLDDPTDSILPSEDPTVGADAPFLSLPLSAAFSCRDFTSFSSDFVIRGPGSQENHSLAPTSVLRRHAGTYQKTNAAPTSDGSFLRPSCATENTPSGQCLFRYVTYTKNTSRFVTATCAPHGLLRVCRGAVPGLSE